MAMFNFTPASILSNINSGINLLTNLTASDVVGIFNQDSFRQVFENARPMKASVRESSKVMDYPVETGATLSDHHVINPVMIEMHVIISAENYSGTYGELRTAFISATKLAIQTRVGTYQNMIIAEMPHEEDSDMADAVVVSLRMREVIFVVPLFSGNQPENFIPLMPANQSIISRGVQIAKSAVSGIGAVTSFLHAGSLWGIRL